MKDILRILLILVLYTFPHLISAESGQVCVKVSDEQTLTFNELVPGWIGAEFGTATFWRFNGEALGQEGQWAFSCHPTRGAFMIENYIHGACEVENERSVDLDYAGCMDISKKIQGCIQRGLSVKVKVDYSHQNGGPTFSLVGWPNICL